MYNGAFQATGSEILVNSTTAGVQTDASITALSGGGFVMTWTDNSMSGSDTSGSAVRAQVFDGNGTRLGSEMVVNTAVANAQYQSAATALANGGFVISWTDGSLTGADADGLGVKARIFAASGAASGSEFLINTTTKLNQANPTITSLASGGFVVSWTDASGLLDTKGTGIKAQMFSALGTKVGAEFLVNSTTLNSQNYSSLAGLASGGFIAAWQDGSGQGGDPTAPSVKAQLFRPDGAKIGGEFLVNTTVAASQDQPVAAGLPSGGFVIAWRDTSLQGDTSAAGLKAQIYDATGVRLGSEFQINTTTLNTQDQAAISALPNGGFAVTWHDNSLLASDASGYGVRGQILGASGNKLGSEWVVDTSTAGNQEQPAIATLASGAIAIGWTDYSGAGGDADGSIKAQLYSPVQGSISGLSLSSASVSEAAVENAVAAAISATGALNALYTYSILDDSTGGAFGIDGTDLIVRNSLLLDYEAATSATLTIRANDGFGNSFDQVYTLAISDASVEHRFAAGSEALANSTTPNNQQQPAIAALGPGKYVLTWADGSGIGGDPSSYGVKAQLVDASGGKIGGEFLVNTQTLNSQDNPTVATLSSGGFVVAWSDSSGAGTDSSGSGINAQLFDANGTAINAEFLVNQTTLNGQKTPSVASLSAGGFVVSWADLSLQGGDSSISSIKAQLFDASGARLGGEFLVNGATANGQDTPVAAGLATGGFVISWRDSSGIGGDSSKDAVKAQLFQADGSKLGTEVLVNTQTQGNQQQETITGLASGGFVIAWADGSGRGGDADNYGIKLQIFDGAGAKVGGEILANSGVQGAQIAPSISALPNGDFLVSWSDYSGAGPENGTSGVKAQLFSESGIRIGGEFAANTTQVGGQTDAAVVGNGDGSFALAWVDASGQGGDNSGTSIKVKAYTPLPDQGGPPPVLATADSVAATEDQMLVIDPASLLANDTSATGLALTIAGVTAISGGTAALQTDGSIAFTPASNFSGAALFTYVASDGVNSATGRVTVTVAGLNDAPAAADDVASISQNGGAIPSGALLANDTDPDFGDHLTLVASSSLTTLGAQLALDHGDIVYSPNGLFQSLALGQTVTDSFTYTIADSSGVTASASVALTVTGINDAPTGMSLSNARVDENSAGGTLVGTIAAADVDQGDALTYSLLSNAGGRFVVDPISGALTVANGAVLDFETQSSFALVAGVSDTYGASISNSFTLTLNNLPEPKSWTGDNGINVFTAPTNDLWTINGLSGADTLAGNASSDIIYGGSGGDLIDGAGGADLLVGGIGNDTYYVDAALDQIVENYGEGTEIVYASSDFALSANVENLTQTGAADISATGNDSANTLTGNHGSNILRGGNGGDLLVGDDGNDGLFGEAGSDWLQGGNGNDLLVGGAGPDQLTGGSGADVFSLTSVTVASDFDTIKDFASGEDVVSLSAGAFDALAASAGGPLLASFFRSGGQATTTDQHVIYNPSTGNLYYDSDGVGGTAMVQIAFFSTRPQLAAGSFTVS